MTKKDYNKIAYLLATTEVTKEQLIDGFSYLLKLDNPHFDPNRFRAACDSCYWKERALPY